MYVHVCTCTHMNAHTHTHTVHDKMWTEPKFTIQYSCMYTCAHTHTHTHALSHTNTHTHTVQDKMWTESKFTIQYSCIYTHVRVRAHTHTQCSGQNMNSIRIHNPTYLWSPVLSMSPAGQPRRVPSAHCWRCCQQRTQKSLGWRKFGHCPQLFSQMAWKIFNNFPPETAVTLKFNQYYQDLHESVKFSKVITQSWTYTTSFACPVVGCYGIKQ